MQMQINCVALLCHPSPKVEAQSFSSDIFHSFPAINLKLYVVLNRLNSSKPKYIVNSNRLLCEQT